MSMTAEIEKVIRENANNYIFDDESGLIENYQDLLEKGIVRQRGYTLQTIEEKQLDILKTNLSYTLKK